MSKTVAISDDNHTAIVKKQTYIFEEYGISVRISDLTNAAIRLGIDKAVNTFVPKDMRLKIIEKEDVVT